MLIDFVKLRQIVPEKGSVTVTVKPSADGKLSVIYHAKHTLEKVSTTYEKGVDGEKTAIEQSARVLNQPLAFIDTAEALNDSFEGLIARRSAAERDLATAVNDSTKALNEQIDALKKAKDARKGAKPSAKPAEKAEQPKEELKKEALGGGLFGTMGSAGAPAAPVAPAAADGPETSEINEEESVEEEAA